MKLKKLNAALSLLAILLLLAHLCYVVYAYLTFRYDPALSKLLAVAASIAICVHAVLGMCLVFLMGDGTRLAGYPRQNLRTVLQRVSAALMFPLLLPHVRSFALLQAAAENGQMLQFTALLLLEVLFFADVTLHIVTSFSRALVTLGWLEREKTLKTLDRIVWVLGAAVFAVSSAAVVRTQLIMFLH